MPRLHLPTVQRWDCHSCGQCCKEYHVHITPEERARIEGQGWDADPALAGVALFTHDGDRDRLSTRADGACVFLGDDGLCRIHGKLGLQAKPLACQIYPYVLVPVGKEWRVSYRYACPSAIDNRGRDAKAVRGELERFAAGIGSREGIDGPTPPPPMRPGQQLEWAELDRLNATLVNVLTTPALPFPKRVAAAFEMVKLCSQARFESVRGARFGEFLDLVSQSVVADLSAAGEPMKPSAIAGVVFRQHATLQMRRDSGPNIGMAKHGRWALLRASFTIARGVGSVPAVHAQMPVTTFDDLERPAAEWPAASVSLLERYFRTKLESFQYCGPSNFGMDVIDGLTSLLATFPAVAWIARGYRDRSREDAVKQALRMVDDNFAYSKPLGTPRQRWAVRFLLHRGDWRTLTMWYGK